MTESTIFTIGGTVQAKGGIYLPRPADDELLQHCLVGDFSYVLTARQMGKSSLMVRTAERLNADGIQTAIIDLNQIGTTLTAEQWYLGLVDELVEQLSLDVDYRSWWSEHDYLGVTQRLSRFLREIALEKIEGRFVIFIDEIDTTLSLPFSDDFFAAIRACYNARSTDPAYKELAFVLLGVATPGDLIHDPQRTPFNIGERIDLTDFNLQEAMPLVKGFDLPEEEARQVLGWVLDWTGGHPYLTQRFCRALVEREHTSWTEELVATVVEETFFGERSKDDDNLQFVRDMLTKRAPNIHRTLKIYKDIRTDKIVLDEEQSVPKLHLKISGIVHSKDGHLVLRNRIYAHIFNLTWVKSNMPVTIGQRIILIMSVITAIALGVAGWFYYQQQNQAKEVLAQTYTESFTTSQSNEVRISSLAGLYGLGDEYVSQADELFNQLSYDEQLRLLDIAIPETIGNELYTVISNNYQEQPNTTEGNEMLGTMSKLLEKASASGTASLAFEISYWLRGRAEAEQGLYETAIEAYGDAWNKSLDRNQENAGVLFDRALAYIDIEKYDLALTDLNTIAEIDSSYLVKIRTIIVGNQDISNRLLENKTNYPNIAGTLDDYSTPTPSLTPTPAPPPTPTPIVTFTSAIDGMTLSYIPAGEFEMGSDIGYQDERPAHPVYLDAFWIDQTEVTNEMYSLCVKNGKCDRPKGSEHYYDNLYINHPVTNISWYDATNYCQWVGGDLPTEAQWEKAARGGLDGRVYPWGEETPDCTQANFTEVIACVGGTSPVGIYPANGYALYDMAGNVIEWTKDWHSWNRYLNEVDNSEVLRNPTGPEFGLYKTVRGGSWHHDTINLIVTYRQRYFKKIADGIYIGFRCVRNIDE